MPSRQPAGRRRYKILRELSGVLLRAADRDVINLYWLVGTIVRVAAHPRDLLQQRHAGVIALAEDGVSAVQARIGNLGDEELRAVGVGTGIGIGQTPWTIELQVGRSFILEGIAGIASS